MNWIWSVGKRNVRMTPRSLSLCPDTRIGTMTKSLTLMPVKFEILTRHPREEVKADEKNEPGFKGVVLAGDVNEGGLSAYQSLFEER